MSGFSWVFVRVIFVDNWKLQIDFEGYFHNDGILGQNIKCGCLNIYIVLQTKAFVPIAENKSLDGVASRDLILNVAFVLCRKQFESVCVKWLFY